MYFVQLSLELFDYLQLGLIEIRSLPLTQCRKKVSYTGIGIIRKKNTNAASLTTTGSATAYLFYPSATRHYRSVTLHYLFFHLTNLFIRYAIGLKHLPDLTALDEFTLHCPIPAILIISIAHIQGTSK